MQPGISSSNFWLRRQETLDCHRVMWSGKFTAGFLMVRCRPARAEQSCKASRIIRFLPRLEESTLMAGNRFCARVGPYYEHHRNSE